MRWKAMLNRAWLVPAVCALAGAVVASSSFPPAAVHVPDVDQIWYAAQALMHGHDPYSLIGPDRQYQFDWPFYYPMTAAVAGLPLGLLSLEVARQVFVGLGGGLLGYAIGRYRPSLWPVLVSLPFANAARNAQWSPYIAASLLVPWVGPVGAVKPNIALAMLAGARSRRHAAWLILGGLTLLIISLAWRPDWPREWRETLAGAAHFRPLILRPGGFVMLAALASWRDPDARLLLGLALVPQTGIWYEALPATLVARSARQSILLTLTAWIVFHWTRMPMEDLQVNRFSEQSWYVGTRTLWSVLVPALVMVLARRPAILSKSPFPE